MPRRSYKVTLIPGEGIGPSVTDAAVRIIAATGVNIDWEAKLAGQTALEKFGTLLPNETLGSIRKNKVALKGPLATPIGAGFRSVNVALRKEFELYANVRPIRSFAGVNSRYGNVDLVIVRENVEEFYVGNERYLDSKKTAGETVGIITKTGSERVARFAYEYARKHGRRKVTIIHKANILKCTHGIFLETAQEIARDFPEIVTEERIADNAAMQLVLNPDRFDVILTTNLLGDILSDLCAGLVGGLGLAAGANFGQDAAIFEAVHGTAPDIAGKNMANPCAIILSAAMMLKHLGEDRNAWLIEHAVRQIIKEGKNVTRDLNPQRYIRTVEMSDAIIKMIKSLR